MENLNSALKYPDAAWAYFRMLDANDIALMDKLLVERNHPLAYQPGTKENRFRALHASKYQF